MNSKIEFYLDKYLDKKIESEVRRIYVTGIYQLEELLSSGKISQEDFDRYRKVLLNLGNSTIRNLQEEINLIFENIQLK